MGEGKMITDVKECKMCGDNCNMIGKINSIGFLQDKYCCKCHNRNDEYRGYWLSCSQCKEDNEDYKKHWYKTKPELIKNLGSRIVENGLNFLEGEFKVYRNITGWFKRENLILFRNGYKKKGRDRLYKYEGFLRDTIKGFHIWLDEKDYL